MLFAACFGSCKKESSIQDNATHKSPNLQSSYRIVNGFDFSQFGISHNDFLAWMDLNNAFSLDDSNRHALALTYIDGYFGNYTYNQPLNEFLVSVDSVNSWSDRTIDGNFSSQFLSDQSIISDSMVLFLNKLSDIFFIAGTNDYIPSELNLSIDSLEDWVVSNYTITIDESSYNCSDGGAMLAICAIAKNSYEYWYNKFDDGSEGRGILGRIWRAIKIAACDSYGFVVDGWTDTNGNGTKDTWISTNAVAGAGERSYNAGH